MRGWPVRLRKRTYLVVVWPYDVLARPHQMRDWPGTLCATQHQMRNCTAALRLPPQTLRHLPTRVPAARRRVKSSASTAHLAASHAYAIASAATRTHPLRVVPSQLRLRQKRVRSRPGSNHGWPIRLRVRPLSLPPGRIRCAPVRIPCELGQVSCARGRIRYEIETNRVDTFSYLKSSARDGTTLALPYICSKSMSGVARAHVL